MLDATVNLKPADRILSGKEIQAYLEVRNLSAMLHRIEVYVVWLHPKQIPFKSKKEEITLAPLGNIIRVYTHRPIAKEVTQFE
jgi:hypothetical protein